MLRSRAVRCLQSFAFLLSVGLAACGDSSTGLGPVGAVILDPLVVTLHPGGTVVINATLLDSHGSQLSGKLIVWESSDTLVARVNQSGLVSAFAPGHATISATSEGQVGLAGITVTIAPVATVTLPFDSLHFSAGDTLRLSVETRDSGGGILTGRTVNWISSAPAVASVSASGLVTALDSGAVLVRAECEGVEDTIAVMITLAAKITIVPSAFSVMTDSSLQLQAVVERSNGDTLPGYPVVWSSDDKGVVLIGQDGIAHGIGPGTATITATSDVIVGQAMATVVTVASMQVSPDTVALVPGGLFQFHAKAFKSNGDSIPGFQPTWSHTAPAVATLTTGGFVTGLTAGLDTIIASAGSASARAPLVVLNARYSAIEASEWSHVCAVATDSTTFCWGSARLGTGLADTSPAPVAVQGPERLVQVTTGDSYSCGLTAGGAAYCWGNNSNGRLGLGNDSAALTPQPVVGGHAFAVITAGRRHTCALTSAGEAWCWGVSLSGGAGTGAGSAVYTTPAAVAGGLTFRSISAGFEETTCGVAVDSVAYCWGQNDHGQVGSTDTASAILAPAMVTGGYRWLSINTGGYHTCGVVVGGAGYCWGRNTLGELGTGDSISSNTPRPVIGGLNFVAILPAQDYTCGLTTGGAAYCWGSNFSKQLGDGTTTDRAAPEAVSGGLTFTAISPGFVTACGIATDGYTYCWGSNFGGTLGTGPGSPSMDHPVRVAGQQ